MQVIFTTSNTDLCNKHMRVVQIFCWLKRKQEVVLKGKQGESVGADDLYFTIEKSGLELMLIRLVSSDQQMHLHEDVPCPSRGGM